MSSFLRTFALLALARVAAGCAPAPAALPTAADVPPVSPPTADAGEVSAHGLPQAVFETRPVADAWDIIRGRTSLTVRFNNCRSRPASEEDELKYTYDWTDDGSVDAFGTCRQSFRYSTSRAGLAEQARICVSDRRGHEVCKVWYIRLGRAAM